ncbi:MAG TPA: arsinothricin resistance N-acetyltransferase ArsN1 family B [Chthoniobacterales bacterium]|nr:arsinothricin resistance N-acetyltransferase ArsN1 family B [Chthoniobacterales bacterium]
MQLTDDSIRLRLAEAADAAQIATIYAPFCLGTAVSFETAAPDEGQMLERISTLTQRYPWLVAVSETGDVLGYAYAGKHRERAAYRWSVDFTAYLAPEAKRRGIGTALYGALIKICQSLGYCRAFAGITLPNEASVRLHEKIGFRAIGVYRRVGFKLGRWHDVGWWSLDLLPEEDEPRGPRSIAEILASGELEEILG